MEQNLLVHGISVAENSNLQIGTIMKKCYIVGAGEFAKEKFKPNKTDFIIAADGGMDYLNEAGFMPNVIIGDMDSISEEAQENVRHQKNIEWIKLPVEKDDTDVMAAIRLAVDRGYEEFHIFGGCGGRLDHTLANINCLTYLKILGFRGYLYGINENLQVIENETICFPSDIKGRISIFSIGDNAEGITLKGLKYLLNNDTMTNSFPIGVSNEFTGQESSITVKKGKLLLVY